MPEQTNRNQGGKPKSRWQRFKEKYTWKSFVEWLTWRNVLNFIALDVIPLGLLIGGFFIPPLLLPAAAIYSGEYIHKKYKTYENGASKTKIALSVSVDLAIGAGVAFLTIFLGPAAKFTASLFGKLSGYLGSYLGAKIFAGGIIGLVHANLSASALNEYDELSNNPPPGGGGLPPESVKGFDRTILESEDRLRPQQRVRFGGIDPAAREKLPGGSLYSSSTDETGMTFKETLQASQPQDTQEQESKAAQSPSPSKELDEQAAPLPAETSERDSEQNARSALGFLSTKQSQQPEEEAEVSPQLPSSLP